MIKGVGLSFLFVFLFAFTVTVASVELCYFLSTVASFFVERERDGHRASKPPKALLTAGAADASSCYCH